MFYKYNTVRYIFWQIFKEIVENQDFRSKTTFEFLKNLFFYVKDFIFVIICKMYKLYNKRFSKKCDLVTDTQAYRITYRQSDS